MKQSWTLITILMISGFARGQPDNYMLESYTMKEGLSQMKTTCMIQDSRGYLWIGTRNGLNQFNGSEFRIYTEKEGLLHNRVNALLENSKGEIVILTADGISIFDGQQFKDYSHPFNLVSYDMYEDSDGSLVISGGGAIRFKDGLFTELFSDKNSTYIRLSDDDQNQYLVKEQQGYSVEHEILREICLEDLKDTLWLNSVFPYASNWDILIIPSTNYFYVEYNIPAGQIRFKCRSLLNVGSQVLSVMTPNSQNYQISEIILPNTVVIDQNSVIWISGENGLGQLQPKRFKHYPYQSIPYAWSIIEDNNQQIWLGTYGHGLFKYDYNQDLFNPVRGKNGLRLYHASALQSESGSIYFAGQFGFMQVDQSNLFHATVFQPSFALTEIGSELIVGTYSGVAIFQNDTFSYDITMQDGVHENNYIQNLTVDREGYLWAGSYKGVSRIDLQNRKVLQTYTQGNARLPSKSVFSGLMDQTGQLWLGSDVGLLYYSYEQDSLILINSNVVAEPVKSLWEIDDKHLLLGAKNGLYIFNHQRYLDEGAKLFTTINATNGYEGIEPGFTGIYEDSRSNIWICSATSVDRIPKSELRSFRNQLEPVITSINRQGLPYDESSNIYELSTSIDDVHLTYDAIGSIRPPKTMFQYQLDDGEWSEWVERDQVQLNGVSHGVHTFKLRVGPTDLPVHQTKTASIQFRANLRLYQRTFFLPSIITLMVLLTLVLLWLVWNRKRQSVRMKHVEKQAKYFQSQLLLSELNPHFIFNVLASIQNKILTNQKEKASQDIIKLSKLIRNFLDATHRSNQNFSDVHREISLEKEIELLTSYIEFEQEKSNHHFDYVIKHSDQLLDQGIYLPPMLIQPFVENAIKHGLLPKEKKGLLTLSFDYNENLLNISVRDNGVGREAASKNDLPLKKSSLGSSILAERAQLLNELGYNISINILDNEPQGTIVNLSIKDENA